jgi:hypothetical protein
MFPDQSKEIMSQHESAIVLSAAVGLSIFEVNVWGMLFYVTRIDADHHGTEGIYVRQFVGYLLLFIEHAGRMLQRLGYSGPLQIDVALSSLRSTRWLDIQPGGSWFVPKSGSELDDQLIFSVSTTSEELSSKPEAVLMEVLKNVFFAVNWSDLVKTTEKLEKLIREGRSFNQS